MSRWSKKPPSGHTVQHQCGGTVYNFFIVNDVAEEWYNASQFQDTLERLWCRDHIKHGMHVVDCGAHHGLMTILFSKWTWPGRVTSYEIVPFNRDVIQRNVVLNACDNVKIRPYGLGSRKAMMRLSLNAGNANTQGQSIRFPVTTLDEDLAGQRVEFLKIDVEGSEVEMLKGARQIITQQRPIICLEVHNFLFENRTTVANEIQTALVGYRCGYQPTPEDIHILPLHDFAWLTANDNPHVYALPS